MHHISKELIKRDWIEMEKFSTEEKKSKLSNVIVELSKAQNTLEKPETLGKNILIF